MYLLCMEQRTTIQIERETLERMKALRITKRETYDEIINRLIKNAKDIQVQALPDKGQ